MFKNLYRKIYLPIVIIAIALIVFVDVFAIILQSNTLNNAYRNMGEKRIARALDSYELYISSAAAFTYNLSLDSDVIAKLKDANAKSVTDKLNTVCNYSLKMNAVSLYSLDGAVYTSSTVTNVPTLDELKTNADINAFLTGENDAAVSMRTDNIADIYDNVAYPAKMGIISVCQKVYDDDSFIGVIFTDILPSNLYKYVFAEGQFKEAIAFIYTEEDYFEYNNNSDYEDLLTAKNSNYFKYSETADNNLFTITVFDSKKEYNSRITRLVLIMATASVLVLIFAVVAARLTAKGVTSKLDRLSQKMSEQIIP